MNNKLLWLLFLFTLSSPQLFSNKKQLVLPQYQPAPGDTLEVIIGVTINDDTSVENLRTILSSVPNIKVMCFCQNLGAFIVRVTDAGYSSVDDAFTACEKKAGNDFKIYNKTGTVKELLPQCTTSPHDDPAKIKELIR
jgi:hypothetical protein